MSRINEAVSGNVPFNSTVMTVDELNDVIKRASAAQKYWQELPLNARIKYILKIKDFIVENADRIAETISGDNGKTRFDAMSTEVLPSSMAISHYCKYASKYLKDKKLYGANIILINKRSKIVRIPYGVIGIISPWNYPFAIPLSSVVMGLLAGNSIILKTASETPLSDHILYEAIESARIPKGIFNFVNMPGKVAGDAFLDGGVDKLFFTGSVQVGKYLMEKASKYLTPLCLELGGNDAMIVCEDADPYRAAMGALWAGFQNAGQSCGGVERLYVHSKIYNDFMKIFKEKIDSLRVGYDNDFTSDVGCMTTQRQMDVVNRHIKNALDNGAKIFAQSKLPPDINGKNILPATVLTDVDHSMEVMRDETFGPVVGVMKFNDYDEAVRLANDSYLGLTGSVWTNSPKRGEEIARKIKAGVITINDHLASHGFAETPWGGFKQSGTGRTHGELGFDEMTQPMTIVRDMMPFVKKNLWWHPHSKNLYEGLRGAIYFLYGKKLSGRIKGGLALLKTVPRIFKKD